MLNSKLPINEMAQGLLSLVQESPLPDVEKMIREKLNHMFQDLDLVSREEFDVQVALVNKLRERIDILEKKLEERS